jgi:hypothetical protein
MARRPVGSDPGAEIKCYLSNAPATIALAELAAVGCLRWTIEEDFELAKGEVGLDHYEVTKYRGWYHHITLSLLALAFLKAVQRDLPPPAEPGTPAAVQSIPIGTQPPTGCPRHNPVATDAAPGNGCVFNTADMVWRIFPGNYPGGITVQKGTVYMDPGIYWIGGGGVTVRGGGSTPNTAVLVSKATSDNTGYNPSGGVLIYNTQDPNPAVAAACVTAPTGNGCYGPIDLNGGASTLALVPYQFAPYQNMVIFMDRAAPLSATITLNGGDSNLSVSGTIYAPHTIVEMRGGASDTISAQLIVWNFQLNGNGSSLTMNYDAGNLFHLSGTGLVQ